MDLQVYQQAALATESKIDKISFDKTLLVSTLQAFVLISEILDAYKKEIYYKKNEKSNTITIPYLDKLSGIVKQIKNQCNNKSMEFIDINTRLVHAILGIATEASELVEILIDQLNGIPNDPIHIMEEGLGDLCWYQAILADSQNLNWNEGLERNIAKLKARYPEKFTTENATNRNLEAERAILEGNLK